jgi:MFS family permease
MGDVENVSNRSGLGKLAFTVLALAFVSQMNTIASVIMADVAAYFPNASVIAIQYIMQMGMIGEFPISLAVGFLTRKIRIKTMLLIGLACIITGGIVPVVYHESLIVLYIGAFIVGAGQGFLIPLVGVVILQFFEGKKKDSLLGLNTTFGTGGATLLLLLAGPIALRNWSYIYLLYMLAIPVFFITVLFLPRGELTPAPPPEAASKAPIPAKAWIQCVFVALTFVCFVSFALNVSMYIVGEGLGDATASGLAMSIVTVAGAALGVIFQALIKALKLFIGAFSALFGFIGMLIVCLAGNVIMVYIAAALLGLCFGAQLSAVGYIIGRICNPEQIAPTFSVTMSCMTFGVILSPIIINVITAAWGGTGPIGVFITSAVLFGILTVLQIIWNAYLTRTCPEQAGEAAVAV